MPSLLNDKWTGYRILGSEVFLFLAYWRYLYQLLIYCLSAPNSPFFAILSDNRPELYRLHFFLARRLGIRLCQERAPEGHYKAGKGRRKKGNSPSPLFPSGSWSAQCWAKKTEHQKASFFGTTSVGTIFLWQPCLLLKGSPPPRF